MSVTDRIPVQGVSLDAAGTLIGVARPVAETYCCVASRFGIALQPSILDAEFRKRFPAMPALAFGPCDQAELERRERQWWRQLVSQCVGDGFQHPCFEDFFHALFEHYRSAEAWRLFPEVDPLLSALAARGIPAVVTSNFDSRLLDVLEGLGVRHRFRTVIYSSGAGSAKPAPDIFARSCRALGLPAAGVLHVGDDRVADLDGARGAGLQARRVCRDDALVSTLDEVPDLLAIVPLLSVQAEG